jgi:phage shock protein PspC (stress-responsive transcriptional regulator)
LHAVTRMQEWFRANGLVRPRQGRILGGVCAGLARPLDTSARLVRVFAVLSIVLPGPQVLAYVLLWILMPEE